MYPNVSIRDQFHSFNGRGADIIWKESKAMNINLTPEQEKIIKEKLKSGNFCSVEEVIGEALQVLREKELASASNAHNGSQRDAVKQMLEFVEKNHVRLEGTSVKQLIREGRRQ
jgi:putative addiction module CopG family antidote